MNQKNIKFNIYFQGGLGNQLYIYSFFRRIMRIYPFITLSFNNKYFFLNDVFSRKYRLFELKLDIETDNSNDLDKFFNIRSPIRFFRAFLNKIFGPNFTGIVEEKYFSYEKLFYYLDNRLFVKSNYALVGYWQIENFKKIHVHEINFLRGKFIKYIGIYDQIKSIDFEKSLGIHLRTDHESVKKDITDIVLFLKKKINYLSNYGLKTLLVAQDKIGFFESHILPKLDCINLEYYVLEGSDLEDMYALSNCKNLILTPQSTFSNWIFYLSKDSFTNAEWF